MRSLPAFLLAAFLLCPLVGLVGCDSGGIKEGIDKDAPKATAGPPGISDDMRAKMEKKK